MNVDYEGRQTDRLTEHQTDRERKPHKKKDCSQKEIYILGREQSESALVGLVTKYHSH